MTICLCLRLRGRLMIALGVLGNKQQGVRAYMYVEVL